MKRRSDVWPGDPSSEEALKDVKAASKRSECFLKSQIEKEQRSMVSTRELRIIVDFLNGVRRGFETMVPYVDPSTFEKLSIVRGFLEGLQRSLKDELAARRVKKASNAKSLSLSSKSRKKTSRKPKGA